MDGPGDRIFGNTRAGSEITRDKICRSIVSVYPCYDQSDRAEPGNCVQIGHEIPDSFGTAKVNEDVLEVPEHASMRH